LANIPGRRKPETRFSDGQPLVRCVGVTSDGSAPDPTSVTVAERVLAVDAGQSATRAAGGTGPGVVPLGAPGAIAHVAGAIAAAAVDARDAALCVGLSGYVPGDAALTELARELERRLSPARVVLSSDVVTSYLGALGARAGVVVAAGSGTVALAADGRGGVAVVDGYGHLLGDDGSAFAVGRAGLRSALRDFDGRGGSAALRARAQAMFGPLERLPAAIYADGGPVKRIAAFAPEVAAAAREGDAAAAGIWSGAGRALAAAARAAAERVFGRGEADVSWTGGVFAAGDLALEPFRAALPPRLRPRPPRGGSLDGAALLAGAGVAEMFGPWVRR
jgi:N-acetylglucosamine kinase-like BadF-type ATPase